MSKGAAISVTRRDPCRSRTRIARRVGSARAVKVRLSEASLYSTTRLNMAPGAGFVNAGPGPRVAGLSRASREDELEVALAVLDVALDLVERVAAPARDLGVALSLEIEELEASLLALAEPGHRGSEGLDLPLRILVPLVGGGGARENRVEQLLGRLHRRGRALAAAQDHPAVVGGHRVQPALEADDLVLEEGGREVLVDLHHRVLGILPVAEVAQAHAEREVRVPLEEVAEEGGVGGGLVAVEQLAVGGGRHRPGW